MSLARRSPGKLNASERAKQGHYLRRERLASESVVHPKEQAELRERARENAIEDIDLLIANAEGRAKVANPRTKFLVAWERCFLIAARSAVNAEARHV